MSDDTTMTKMAWLQNYSDDSGVKYGVSYDADKKTEEGCGAITIEAIDTAEFPQSQIHWLISCLTKIRDEQGL